MSYVAIRTNYNTNRLRDNAAMMGLIRPYKSFEDNGAVWCYLNVEH